MTDFQQLLLRRILDSNEYVLSRFNLTCGPVPALQRQWKGSCAYGCFSYRPSLMDAVRESSLKFEAVSRIYVELTTIEKLFIAR